jgi:hypothetical protein
MDGPSPRCVCFPKLFGLLCIAVTLVVVCNTLQSLVLNLTSSAVWFAHAVNKAYLRLRSIVDTATAKSYFEEIISCGLGPYLQAEYHKAMGELGNASYHHIYRILYEEGSILKNIVNVGLGDASLVSVFVKYSRGRN